MLVDNDGDIVRTAVPRMVAGSNSPLADALQSLVRGPNAEEKQRGITTLIPEGTKLLSVTIRNSIAFINFNENFMFNTYGAEGYLAQLRQVIWTATEFPSVTSVQILIEGNKTDFLGENIRIGSPISRD